GLQCLEGGADAARSAAPARRFVGSPRQPAARVVPRVQEGESRQEAGRVSRPRAVDGAARRELCELVNSRIGELANWRFEFTNSPVHELTKSLIKIEISRGPRDWLLLRLLQRLFEAPRQRVAARLLRFHRLLEHRFAARRLLGDNALRLTQLRLVAALGLQVRHDAAEVRVDDERGVTAGANHFDLRLEPRHYFLPPPNAPARPLASNCFFNSSGLPSGSVAVKRRSRTCIRRKSNRCPKP